MPTIHTSRKLEKLIKKHIVADAKGDPGQPLDLFYAEVLTIHRKRCWIVIHEPTLYCVILPDMTGKRVANAGQVLAKALEEQWRYEGIIPLTEDMPPALKVGVLQSSVTVQLGRTNGNRKTVGYLRDRIYQATARMYDYLTYEAYSFVHEAAVLNQYLSTDPEGKSRYVHGRELMCKHLGLPILKLKDYQKPFPGEAALIKPLTKEQRHAADMAYYDALEAQTNADFRQNLSRALHLNPKHIATRLILLESEPLLTKIYKLTNLLKDAEEELGKDFERYKGAFWGFHETRPYMRVRDALAQALAEDGKEELAIAHWQEMLVLNPNDNQGLRYVLAASYLRQNRLQDFQRLYNQFIDEASGHWAWYRVFYGVLGGEVEPRLAPLLADAKQKNRFVLPLLKHGKAPKGELPGHYMMGSQEEAVVILEDVWVLVENAKVRAWVTKN